MVGRSICSAVGLARRPEAQAALQISVEDAYEQFPAVANATVALVGATRVTARVCASDVESPCMAQVRVSARARFRHAMGDRR